MAPKDILIACFVAVLWGTNFIVIKYSLLTLPPMLMGALRFLLASLPAIFLVPRPKIPWKYLLAFSMLYLFGQFIFLFFAMDMGMPAGLASLLMQSHIFFTLIFSYLFFKERAKPPQVLGIGIAAVGLICIGHASYQGHMPLIGFLLTLIASILLALGNIVTRNIAQRENINIVHFVIWANIIPIVPYFLLSVLFDGIDTIQNALLAIDVITILSLLYQAIFSTIIGFTLWSYLFKHYSPNQIVPYGLLIPVFGLLAAYLLLGETLSYGQQLGAALLMAGLFINVFSSQILTKIRGYLEAKR